MARYSLASIMNCHVIATLWRKETMSKQCCPGYPGRRHAQWSAMSQHSRVSWSEFYLGKSGQCPSLPESGTATAHKGTYCCHKATVYLLACLSPHQYTPSVARVSQQAVNSMFSSYSFSELSAYSKSLCKQHWPLGGGVAVPSHTTRDYTVRLNAWGGD